MKDKSAEPGKEVAAASRSSNFLDLIPWFWGRRGGAVDDPFEGLQKSMNRMLETFRKDFGGLPGNGDFGVVSSRMDISETDDAWEVKVELPGMDEKNVDVSVTRDALRIHGEKKSETSGKKKDCHYRECSYGSVERVVPLPDGIDTDKVAAKFKNGVLAVTLPKTPDAKAKKGARKVEVAA